MKNKLIVLLLSFLVIVPKVEGQSNNQAAAIAGAAVGAAALLTYFASVERYTEMLEANATEYYIGLGNDGMFNLQLLLDKGTTLKDQSNTGVKVFSITERQINKTSNREEITARKIMTVFTSGNWINEYGIKWNLVTVKIWSRNEWADFYLAYLSAASPIKFTHQDSIPLFSKVNFKNYENFEGVKYSIPGEASFTEYFIKSDYVMSLSQSHTLSKRGMRMSTSLGEFFVPFYNLNGDTYIVNDYDKDYKIAFNEKKLGIYVKKEEELVEIRNDVLTQVRGFFW